MFIPLWVLVAFGVVLVAGPLLWGAFIFVFSAVEADKRRQAEAPKRLP